MIEIKNLTKIFKSKKHEKCCALNSINLTLPDSGMVFVVGKSGSGKTTLLSLIGTLDNITSGDILVDGLSLKSLKEKDAANYRNEKIGFIYQDYHLIDEITVFENIKISLNLKNESNDESIYKALENVGLKGYEKRYPKELSGGEKQRIAIARAIVKNPSIILADEPTGNLDSNTTINILNLLKSLSKDRLVLIVSHDVKNARLYADKLINLQQGKIISVLKRNPKSYDGIVLKGDTLYVPEGRTLTKVEEDFINTNISKIKRFIQTKDQFVEEKEQDSDLKSIEKIPQITNKIKAKHNIKLGFKLFKNKLVSTFIYSLILTALINVLGLAQLMSNYPEDEMLNRALSESQITTLSLKRENTLPIEERTGKKLDIPEEDYEKFASLPLKGHVYKEINFTFTGNIPDPSDYYLYVPYYGLIVCDDNYINQVLYNNEKAEIIYNPNPSESGYLITDAVADGIIYRFNKVYKNYDDIFDGPFLKPTHSWKHGIINGIIKTDYKDKYADMLKYFDNGKLKKDRPKDLLESKRFIEFNDKMKNVYLKKYSTDKDIVTKSANTDFIDWSFTTNAEFNYNGVLSDFNHFHFFSNETCEGLKDNEIRVSDEVYKQLTGIELDTTNYDSLFKPIDVTFDYFPIETNNFVKPKKQLHFTIISAKPGPSHYVGVSKNTLHEIILNERYTIGLHFDNIEDSKLITDKAAELGYVYDNGITDMYQEVGSMVSTFSNLFNLIMVILLVGVILLLVIFALRSIKAEMENIGILKSLGTRTQSLIKMFSIRTIAVCIFTSILYLITFKPFIMLSNKALEKSINIFAHKEIIGGFDLIAVSGMRVFINIIFIFVISLIAFLIEVIRLRRIKPINIMKAKE